MRIIYLNGPIRFRLNFFFFFGKHYWISVRDGSRCCVYDTGMKYYVQYAVQLLMFSNDFRVKLDNWITARLTSFVGDDFVSREV